MKNIEWINRVISHQEGLPIPYNIGFLSTTRRLIEKYYDKGSIEEALNYPIRETFLNETKPQYASPDIYGKTIKDDFGVIWETSHIKRGVPIKASLKDAFLKKL